MEEFIECEVCGRFVKKINDKDTSRKYCNFCYASIRNEQNKNKALKYYYKNKTKTLPEQKVENTSNINDS